MRLTMLEAICSAWTPCTCPAFQALQGSILGGRSPRVVGCRGVRRRTSSVCHYVFNVQYYTKISLFIPAYAQVRHIAQCSSPPRCSSPDRKGDLGARQPYSMLPHLALGPTEVRLHAVILPSLPGHQRCQPPRPAKRLCSPRVASSQPETSYEDYPDQLAAGSVVQQTMGMEPFSRPTQHLSPDEVRV